MVCDDPTFDLAAERERRRVAYFEKSLTRALVEGTGGHCSDSPMDSVVHDAFDMLAERYPHATDDDVALVREVFRRGAMWAASARSSVRPGAVTSARCCSEQPK